MKLKILSVDYFIKFYFLVSNLLKSTIIYRILFTKKYFFY